MPRTPTRATRRCGRARVRAPRPGLRAAERHRTADAGPVAGRQGARDQPLERRILSGQRGAQAAALIAEPVAPAQQRQGAVVDGDQPGAAVELDDARADVVEQIDQRRAEGPGLEQRVPDSHEMAQMRQQPPDRLDPLRGPAVAVDGIADRPHDARSVGPVEAHEEAVLAAHARQQLVVDRRGLALRLGRERRDMRGSDTRAFWN